MDRVGLDLCLAARKISLSMTVMPLGRVLGGNVISGKLC